MVLTKVIKIPKKIQKKSSTKIQTKVMLVPRQKGVPRGHFNFNKYSHVYKYLNNFMTQNWNCVGKIGIISSIKPLLQKNIMTHQNWNMFINI